MVTIRVSIFVVITDYLRRLLYTLKNCEHSGPNGLSAAYTYVTLLQLRFSGWINSFGFWQVKVKVKVGTVYETCRNSKYSLIVIEWLCQNLSYKSGSFGI